MSVHGDHRIPIIEWMDWMYLSESEATERRAAEHLEMASRAECHSFQGHEYHYCHAGELADFDRRLERV